MKFPSSVLFMALVAPLLLSSPAPAQADEAEEQEVIKVLHIRHTHVTHATEVIQEFIGEAIIYADQRANSLIISATPSVHRRIGEIVAMIDVNVEDVAADDQQVEAIPLSHVNADVALTGTLMSILGGPRTSLRIAHDPSSNQILARGSKATLAEVGRVIRSIDLPPARATPAGTGQLQVRLLWLVDKLGEQGRPVPSDLNPVVTELKALGIDGLRLAAQSVVRTTSGRMFTTSFAAVLQDAWSVRVEGAAEADDAVRELNLKIEAHANNGFGAIDLQATIGTHSGHYVVLSASPIEGFQSVFVVQVTDMEKGP